MQLMVFVLNNIDVLEELMSELSHNGVKGATIIKSTGMARSLKSDDPLLYSLKALLAPNHKENYTILMALSDEMIENVKNIIKSVVGDLTQPDTGVIFTVPISSSEGLKV
ncbi:MAG: hypothetical protein RR549_02315 [Oscillospiraceae bacterium]